MLPLTVGFLIAGPLSGVLSDRFGARIFATSGMLGTALGFGLLEVLPINFSYWLFAMLLFYIGFTMALFGAPNRAAIMNSLPSDARGAGSGMNSTFQNSAQVLSIGLFFTLMIVGLSSSLPASLFHGLVSHGVPAVDARQVADLPPVSTLFAAFLGYNPVQHLLGPHVLSGLTSAQQATLVGRNFFPSIITVPFRSGLHAALDFSILASLLAAAASWTRGKVPESAGSGASSRSEDVNRGTGAGDVRLRDAEGEDVDVPWTGSPRDLVHSVSGGEGTEGS
jgi:MFS family permease